MTTDGKLCHRANDAAEDAGMLCHKNSPEKPLVRKENAPRKDKSGRIEISCTFEPLAWVCNTYHATHAGTLEFAASWMDGPTEHAGAFVLIVDDESQITGTRNLTIDISPKDICAAHEYPETITGAMSVTKGDVTKTVGPLEWHPNEEFSVHRVTITLVDGALTDVMVNELAGGI